jgi:ascorbate-specific PTS system EIIC-type component UlaA
VNRTTHKNIGWLLIAVGVGVVLFSQQIVFPGLERLLGIETLVGSENVVYQADGGYLFTNPGAMVRWILGMAAIGVVLIVIGAIVLRRARHLQRICRQKSTTHVA